MCTASARLAASITAKPPTGETAGDKWKSLQAKVTADMKAIKDNIAQRKHELDAKHAESHANRMEWEVALAIDYTAASIPAELAVYDAIISRAEVTQARNA